MQGDGRRMGEDGCAHLSRETARRMGVETAWGQCVSRLKLGEEAKLTAELLSTLSKTLEACRGSASG